MSEERQRLIEKRLETYRAILGEQYPEELFGSWDEWKEAQEIMCENMREEKIDEKLEAEAVRLHKLSDEELSKEELSDEESSDE